MRKTVLGAWSLVMAILSNGCVQESLHENEKTGGPVTLTITAVTKEADPDMKILYGSVDATWEATDKIYLIKGDGTTLTLSLEEGAGTSVARFTSTDPVVGGTYIPYAVSGASLESGYVSVAGGVITLNLSTPGGGTLAEALRHDILKGNAVTLTEGQGKATISGLTTHLLSYLRFRFSCGTKAITAVGISSAGGIKRTVTIAADGTASGSNATTDAIYVTAGDNGADVYSGYFAVWGSTTTSLVAYAEDEDSGKYARLVSTKTADYTPGQTYGKDYALSQDMVSSADEGSLSSQTWVNAGLSVRWAKYNVGSSYEYSYDRNVGNTIASVPGDWSGWRFATRAEAQELFYACERQWISGATNGVRFNAPNGNYIPMGAGGYYHWRDDGREWEYQIGETVYFYIDETSTSMGDLARYHADISNQGQNLVFSTNGHGNNTFYYGDSYALRLVCDYSTGDGPDY